MISRLQVLGGHISGEDLMPFFNVFRVLGVFVEEGFGILGRGESPPPGDSRK